MIGNPAEVVLVRMCADGAKPPAERFLYPNPIVALYRIGRDEGVKVFGRGMSANIARSVLMSMPLPFSHPGRMTRVLTDGRCFANRALCGSETRHPVTYFVEGRYPNTCLSVASCGNCRDNGVCAG